jgi:hypothetical protein
LEKKKLEVEEERSNQIKLLGFNIWKKQLQEEPDKMLEENGHRGPLQVLKVFAFQKTGSCPMDRYCGCVPLFSVVPDVFKRFFGTGGS